MQEHPSHNNLWFLVARTLSGEATALEEAQLNIILSGDIILQQQYDLLKRMWHAGDKHYANTNDEEKENISRILQLAKTDVAFQHVPAIQIRSRKKYFYAFSSIAAVFILVLTIWLFNKPGKSDITSVVSTTQQLVAENGSRTRTILPDGSTVWLNAGSHISFNQDFSGETREVTLDGEAYFDVVKQSQRPFIVHVSGYDIRVLGTAFNVKSYATDKTVETTLLRGLVQVTEQRNTQQKPIVLHPNEKLIVAKIAANDEEKLPYNNKSANKQAAEKYSITPLNTVIKEDERIETAWVYNRLEFRGDSFEELAGKLERWYNVRIVFEDEAVKQLNFNGSFENETVEQALKALKTATPFNFTIEGREIHISK